ncbi:hypothetical protein CRYUN_Cryun06bG0069000 [Craigia yunnanensis]
MDPKPANLLKTAPFCDGSGVTDGGMEIEDGGFAGASVEDFGGMLTVAGDGEATGGVVIGYGAETGGSYAGDGEEETGAKTGGEVDGSNEVGEGEDAGDRAIVETNKDISRKKQRMLELAIILNGKTKIN